MRFLLVREQSAGCDYTIGCGIACTEFHAEDEAAALEMLRVDTVEHGGDRFGLYLHDIDRARLYVVASSPDVPLDRWHRERNDLLNEQGEAARLADERAEYERLRAKYETEVGNERGQR